MVTLAIMSFMLFSIIFNLSVLKTGLYAMHLQSVGLSVLAVRCCCHHIYIVSQMKATDEPVTSKVEMTVCCLLRVSCVILSG